jgi:HEAT repeat protein
LTQLAHRLAGVALEAKEAQTRLRDLLAAEKHQQAKEVLYLALGWSGDDAVWRDLVAIIKQKGRPLLRACAANALRDCNARLAIPDLLEALKDPEFADEDVPTHPDSPPHGAETVKQPVSRVRGGAAMALEKFGVKIRVPDKTKPYEFEVDKGSAVKAITPELHSKDKNHALQTIEAIARIGGEPARAELRKFVAQYQRDTKKADAVARAKQAISNLGRGN